MRMGLYVQDGCDTIASLCKEFDRLAEEVTIAEQGLLHPLRPCRNRCPINPTLCYSRAYERDALLNAWLFPPSPC
jgi:hypothetical protein